MRLVPTLLLIVLAPAALAQVPPKAGRNWHEDTVAHGFRFKTPKDWAFFPAEFGQLNVVGRYVPERNDVVEFGSGEAMKPTLWMLVFDKDFGAEKKGEDKERAFSEYHKDLKSWLKANPGEVGSEYALVEEDEVKLKDDIIAHERLFKGKGRWVKELHLWSMTYPLSDRKQIVLLFNAPADRKGWGKWKSQLGKIGKTFGRAELEGVDSSGVEGSGLRANKHRKLLEEVASNPGWGLYPTENYFVISNSEDMDFVEEIQARLEAIHERFESEFPREKALRAYEVGKELRTKARRGEDGADGEDGGAGLPGQDGQDAGEGRTEAQEGNPLERARCSVVRVCNNREDYFKYGGPQGSAGYWWSVSEELVIFDDKAVGGRRNTWATLHHEAFHQFIFYFFGNLAPGMWFNEGNADYYSGHKLTRRGRYEVGRFDWRNSTIKEEIRSDKNVPLSTLVEIERPGYYDQEAVMNPRTEKAEKFSRYPHGWSFLYFLRTGKENRAKGWNDEWDGILNTYLDTLIETRDTEKANEQAFAQVDWEKLEESWKTYILKGK